MKNWWWTDDELMMNWWTDCHRLPQTATDCYWSPLNSLKHLSPDTTTTTTIYIPDSTNYKSTASGAKNMKNTVLNSPHSSGQCLLKCFLDRFLHSVWAHILLRFVLRKTPLLVVITIFWPNSGIKAVVLDPPISAGTPQGMGFYIFQIDSGTTQIFNFAQIYFHKMT